MFLIIAMGAIIVSLMLWYGEQITEEKMITATITDIDFSEGISMSDAHYQLTFGDGSWMKIGNLAIVESSLKVGRTYKLSLIMKRNSSNWLIINVTEISAP